MRTFAIYKSPQCRLEYVGEDNGGKKADKCGEPDTADGRMPGDEHAADSGDEHDGTEQNGSLVGIERLVLAGQSMHDEDTVIYANAEDKGGNNDTDKVELYVEKYHHTQHNQPAEQDGCKSQQRVAQVFAP